MFTRKQGQYTTKVKYQKETIRKLDLKSCTIVALTFRLPVDLRFEFSKNNHPTLNLTLWRKSS